MASVEMGGRTVIPSGSGKWKVGAVDLLLARSVFFRLFYPAGESATPANVDWQPRGEYMEGTARFLKVNPRLFRFAFNVFFGMPQQSLCWAGSVGGDGRLPVVVFSHGLGGFRCANSSICAELASHGFAVAAVEHRDGSACWSLDVEGDLERAIPYNPEGVEDFATKNPQVNYRVDECIRTLAFLRTLNDQGAESVPNPVLGKEFDWDQFKGRLDTDKAGICGHSFGGGTTIGALAREPGFKVGVALDAWMFPLDRHIFSTKGLDLSGDRGDGGEDGAVRQPLFFLNASEYKWPVNLAAERRFWDDGSMAERLMVTVRNSTHASMSDGTFLLGPFLGKRLRTRSEMEPEDQQRIYNRLIRAFLGKHLDVDCESLDLIRSELGEDLIPDSPHLPSEGSPADDRVDLEDWTLPKAAL